MGVCRRYPKNSWWSGPNALPLPNAHTQTHRHTDTHPLCPAHIGRTFVDMVLGSGGAAWLRLPGQSSGSIGAPCGCTAGNGRVSRCERRAAPAPDTVHDTVASVPIALLYRFSYTLTCQSYAAPWTDSRQQPTSTYGTRGASASAVLCVCPIARSRSDGLSATGEKLLLVVYCRTLYHGYYDWP
jgi:hypothetical protein